MSSQFGLLREKRLLPLFLTQFLGAFNDNVMKNAMVLLIAFHGAQFSSLDPGLLVNACAGLFILPFFLFSASAGQLADKYEKSHLIRLTKALEILIAILAATGFWQLSLPWLLAALFLMGSQSALFGPLKYAILPQHLHPEELVGGNALVESATFLAILLGTVTGGLLIGFGNPLWAAAMCFLLALAGYGASLFIPHASAAEPELLINPNPFSETWRNIGFARRDTMLFTVMAAISWFWFYGAMFLSQVPGYTRDLGGDESVATLFLAMFSVGIGIGSLLCERLSRGKIEPGLILPGLLGLSLFAIDLYFATPAQTSLISASASNFLASGGHVRILVDLVLLGVAGGLYCVPLYAMLQSRALASHRSRSIAATNILNALFMVVAALLAMLLLGQGLSAADLFLITALINAGIAWWMHKRTPEFAQRARYLMRRD